MDSSKETRWQQRFENFSRAFSLLNEAAGRGNLSDLEAEGMVQRFEYTFELAWKTMKDYLESKGITRTYPRDVIKAAFETGLVDDGETWVEMLERRNEAAHTDNKERFERVTGAIRTRFLAALTALVSRLDRERSSFGLTSGTLEQIRAVLHAEPRVTRAVVFGSRSMGTHKIGSDIDLCVFGPLLDSEALTGLTRELNDRSSTPYRIDVVHYETIDSEPLRLHIDRFGVGL